MLIEGVDFKMIRVSTALIEELKDWSEPVQFRVEERDDGTLDMIVRRVD